jgi:hypothetical protein
LESLQGRSPLPAVSGQISAGVAPIRCAGALRQAGCCKPLDHHQPWLNRLLCRIAIKLRADHSVFGCLAVFRRVTRQKH